MKKLIDIQTELKAPKSQFNKFGGYNYRNCEDILEAVKPLLAKHECFLNISDEIILIGNRYYVKATAALINADGQKIAQSCALAREEETKKGMDGSQITGAASSYARKYALNGLFCIDDTKDADSDGREAQAMTNPKIEKKITNEQALRLAELGVDFASLCAYFQVTDINDLTYKQALQAISMKESKGA